MKSFIRAGLAVGILATLLAGCATAQSADSTSDGGESVRTGGTASITEAPEVLTVGFAATSIRSLDPNVAFLPFDCAALNLIAGTLYDFDEDGKPTPGLASSSTVSDDNLVYTFTLRSGLTFSDGTPLTSEDVKATLDRTINDKTNIYGIFTRNFAGVEVSGDETVTLTLKTPDTHVLSLLMQPAFMIMPSERLVEEDTFFNAPVSSGPYMLKAWDGGGEATFVANPNYWGATPVIPEVRFKAVSDYNTAMAQLATGDLDMAEGFPMSVLPELKKTSAWELNEQYGFFALQLNNTRAPMSDPDVRKAVSLAIDRDQLNNVVWGGIATPLSSLWPSSMTGYDASISTARDLEAATELLAGTSCADGCEIEITAGQRNLQAAEIIAANLAEIGISVRVTQISPETQGANNHSLEYDANVGIIFDFVDIPTGILEFAVRPGGYFNALWSGWENEEIVAAADEAVQSSDGSEQDALARVNELFVEDAPYATLATLNNLWGTQISTDIVRITKSNFIEIAGEGE